MVARQSGIHPKSGFPGFPESANYFDFPQSYSLRTLKVTKFSRFFLFFSVFSSVFVVEINALFPQNILDWGAESANFFAFWMYDLNV